jgi:methionyl-tRNA formyltransferase
MKFWQARVDKGSFTGIAGEIIESSPKSGIRVKAGRDGVVIEELQAEGGRRMSAAEFLSGHTLKAGQMFSHTPNL